MRKRILPAIAGIVLLLLFAAGVYELFFAPSGPVFSETENRMLKERPAFSLSSFLDGSYTDRLEQYLAERFPARTALIGASQKLRQIGNFASWEDYARVAQNDVSDMEYHEDLPDDEPIATPRPTGTPAPSTDTPEPVGTRKQDAQPTDTPKPTPTPRPEKEAVNDADYPAELRCDMLYDGKRTKAFGYGRSRVRKQSAVFDAYASLLPEDGVLVVTIVPNSLRASRLMALSSPEGFASDIEPYIYAVTANNVSSFSVSELLSEPLVNGEYVFFRTDMHWTPYGAYLAVTKMLEEAGETLPPFDAFPKEQEYPFLGSIYRDKPTRQMQDNPDTLDILTPIHPVTVRRYTTPEEYEEVSFIDRDANPRDRYTVYLGGPQGNWTVIDRTDAPDTGKKTCLLITDSYGLCTAPFFAEAYDRVILYDSRFYSKKQMGSVADLLEQNGVQDIFVMLGELHAFDDSYLINCSRHF